MRYIYNIIKCGNFIMKTVKSRYKVIKTIYEYKNGLI